MASTLTFGLVLNVDPNHNIDPDSNGEWCADWIQWRWWYLLLWYDNNEVDHDFADDDYYNWYDGNNGPKYDHDNNDCHDDNIDNNFNDFNDDNDKNDDNDDDDDDNDEDATTKNV